MNFVSLFQSNHNWFQYFACAGHSKLYPAKSQNKDFKVPHPNAKSSWMLWAIMNIFCWMDNKKSYYWQHLKHNLTSYLLLMRVHTTVYGLACLKFCLIHFQCRTFCLFILMFLQLLGYFYYFYMMTNYKTPETKCTNSENKDRSLSLQMNLLRLELT